MRRSDRRDSNFDNSQKHPRSNRSEPESWHDLQNKYRRQLNKTLEEKKRAEAAESELEQLKVRVEEITQQSATSKQLQNENSELEAQVKYNYELYRQFQEQFEALQATYSETERETQNWKIKFQEADAQRLKYVGLYNEAQLALNQARRSKASIKGWETRRKKENEKLKKEISDMVILLRESLAREDAMTADLYEFANRMDRIQSLVDSVEDDSLAQPLTLLQKFKRIWGAIQEILRE